MDLRGPDEFYRDAWTGITKTPVLHDHWSRHPEWNHQTAQYSWFLKPRSPEVLGQLRRVNAALARDSLEPVSADEFHLTLMSIAPVDSVSQVELRELLLDSSEQLRGIQRCELIISGINAFTESVVAEIRPWDALMALRSRLYRSAIDILGTDRVMATEAFYPHLAVAYATADGPATPALNAIGPMRDLRFGVEELSEVILVELTRQDHHYRSTEVSRLQLVARPPRQPLASDPTAVLALLELALLLVGREGG